MLMIMARRLCKGKGITLTLRVGKIKLRRAVWAGAGCFCCVASGQIDRTAQRPSRTPRFHRSAHAARHLGYNMPLIVLSDQTVHNEKMLFFRRAAGFVAAGRHCRQTCARRPQSAGCFYISGYNSPNTFQRNTTASQL